MYSTCNWEVYIQLFWKGENSLLRGIYYNANFPRVSVPGEIPHWRNLSEFLYEILFICLKFFFADEMKHVEVFQEMFSAYLGLFGRVFRGGGGGIRKRKSP